MRRRRIIIIRRKKIKIDNRTLKNKQEGKKMFEEEKKSYECE
jgi:hypothetical protein